MISRRNTSSSKFSLESIRLIFLVLFFCIGFSFVLWKLFSLQITHGQELKEKAYNIRNASISIAARRGGIFVQDLKTNEIAPVALNTTLYTVFFDARSGLDKNKNKYGVSPEDFPLVAEHLTNILYTKEKFSECEKDAKKCPKGSVITITGTDEEDILKEKIPKYEEAKKKFQENLLKNFLYKRENMIWATNVSHDILLSLESQNIPSLSVSTEKQEIYINLIGLTDVARSQISSALASAFGGDAKKIEKKLYSTRRGYIPVMTRVYPDQVKKIKILIDQYNELYSQSLAIYNAEYRKYKTAGLDVSSLIEPKKSPFSGVGFEEVPVRYYPENDLAAQVIGFVNSDAEGQYGIERSLDRILKGEDGILSTARDVKGNAIGISKDDSGKVTDGANVILTIDRTLQKKMEEILDRRVVEFEADSGQIIVIDPKNGEILAMANSPRFNPNFYGEVYERQKVEKKDVKNIHKTTPLEQKNMKGEFVPVKFDTFEKAAKRGAYDKFYWFKNVMGPRVYINKPVMEIYEPGSVMKPLVMAAALEEGEITVNTRYNDKKPIKVGPFTIRNADNRYPGSQSMSNIIERSANIGMSFIAEKMGKPLMYEALKKLGFGEYTHILLPEELSGSLPYYKNWSKARLYTTSFGQGVSMTPLQLVRAWTSLANGGYLVNPRIVKEVQYADGTIEKTTISKKRIFSNKTIEEMNTILISSVVRGVAKNAKVKGHYIAGKTGTSQIISETGGYESIEKGEEGNTITGFIGFAPVDDPQYLVYVKFDRPRKGIRGLAVYGSSTSAPTFAEAMVFIFNYFNVPKDR